MYRLPPSILWILVFTGVLGHFPALAFDFGRFDFLSLAAAAGLTDTPAWTARGWTDLVTWSLWWRASGADPIVAHGTSLLLVAVDAMLIAIVAARIGMPRAGAVLAAVLWLLGPWTGLSIASTTASTELWSLGFALGAVLLWLGGNSRRDPALAAVLAMASLASGGIGLVAPAVLAVASRMFGRKDEDAAVRRGRRALLLVLAALSVASWIALEGRDGAAVLRGPGLAGAWPGPALHQLGSAAWIWPSWPDPGVVRVLGAVLALAMVVALFVLRGRPAPRVRFAVAWVGAALVPAMVLPRLEIQTAALPVAAGLAWLAGALAGPALERILARLKSRVALAAPILMVLVLVGIGPGWAALRTAGLGETGEDGRLVHPALREAGIVAGVRHHVESVMRSPAPPPQLAFLQATRVEVPRDVPIPEGREVILDSPVHHAVAGQRGPALMVAGRATVRWTTLLDQVSRDAFVFLDAGDDRVRPLGPVENARIYAALIAVAAGQFDLARHELWTVVQEQGAEVRFAFVSDHLPIRESELDAQAAPFAHWLREEGSTPSLRLLKFFAQLYESVRGQPLIEEGFGGPLRSGRVDR